VTSALHVSYTPTRTRDNSDPPHKDTNFNRRNSYHRRAQAVIDAHSKDDPESEDEPEVKEESPEPSSHPAPEPESQLPTPDEESAPLQAATSVAAVTLPRPPADLPTQSLNWPPPPFPPYAQHTKDMTHAVLTNLTVRPWRALNGDPLLSPLRFTSAADIAASESSPALASLGVDSRDPVHDSDEDAIGDDDSQAAGAIDAAEGLISLGDTHDHPAYPLFAPDLPLLPFEGPSLLNGSSQDIHFTFAPPNQYMVSQALTGSEPRTYGLPALLTSTGRDDANEQDTTMPTVRQRSVTDGDDQGEEGVERAAARRRIC
jgi:hypothetical protein